MTACNKAPEGSKVLIETEYGDIKIVLYDETPLHRDNFIKLVRDGEYTTKSFYRIIQDFMIQGGQNLPDSLIDKEKNIEPEFRTPKLFHKKGALAAARWGDDENPEKKSDPTEFYIVTGKIQNEYNLNNLEKERFERFKQEIYRQHQSAGMDTIKSMYREGNKTGLAEFRQTLLDKATKEAEERKAEVIFTEEQRKAYQEIGGTPHLDGTYTVFGEVYEGLNVVDKIARVDVNEKDAPLKTITFNISVIE